MKKLLFLLTTLFILMPTAYAEYEIGEYFTELPETLYTPPAVSFFSALTVDEILYKRIESYILSEANDGALQKDIFIPLTDIGIVFDVNDETYNFKYISNIYYNVVYNNPQIGNLITGLSGYTASENSTEITSIRPWHREVYKEQTYQALATDEEKEAYLSKTHNIEAFNEAINYTYSKAIAPDMTEDWQKLLSIHDYLADTITYSPIIANGTDAEKDAYDKSNNYLVYTTYSALVGERISVCQGYALAFKLLCNMAGIECGYAVSASHIWNIAECNGNYYHIDVTWDDPTSVAVSDGNGNNYICTSDHVMHRNFLRSDTDSTILHTKEGDWTTNMPKCDDSEYHSTLLFGKLANMSFPLYWDDGTFWFEEYKYYLYMDTGILKFEPAGIYNQVLSDGINKIESSEYLPNIRLDAKMYNIFSLSDKNYIAIDGAANSTADFYAVTYDEGRLVKADKTDVRFNAYGEAVAEFPDGYNRLFLFADGGMKPLAYSK